MMRTLCVWIARRTIARINSWPWPMLLTGMGAGSALVYLAQQFFSQLGVSPPVVAAAGVTTLAAWAMGWTVLVRSASASDALSRYRGFILCGTLLSVVLGSGSAWLSHTEWMSAAIWESRWLTGLYATVWATLMLGIPIACIARLLYLPSTDGESLSGRAPSASGLLGIAGGIGLALLLTPNSLYTSALFGLVVLTAGQIWRLRSPARTLANSQLTPLEGNGQRNSQRPTAIGAVLPSLLACGGLVSWYQEVLQFLMPGSLYAFSAIAIGLLLGVAWGCRRGQVSQQSIDYRLFLTIGVISGGILVSFGFEPLVYRTLRVNGSIPSVWLLHSIRGMFIISLLAPTALLWTNSARRLAEYSPQASRWAWCFSLLVAAGGMAMTRSTLIPALGFTVTAAVWIWTVALTQALELAIVRQRPRLSVVRVTTGLCLAMLFASPVVSTGVRPELAARLLFATGVYQADQSGVPAGQLAFLDDARLVSQMRGERGLYTAWKSTIARHQIRQNGVPRGSLTTRTQVSPQDTAEQMLAVLPLTLHERPDRVAILGLGAGTPVQTSLEFPVLEVTTVEPDTTLVQLLQTVTRETEAGVMWKDERLSVTSADPLLWVASHEAQYDVIISNPDPSSLLIGAGHYTREFYQRAALRLARDGIFCQRFQYPDYGAAPLRTLAATMRSVFRHVMAVETGPGEMAWLATNGREGLVRRDLLDRMQAPHIGWTMASAGWDWSMLLTLGAYNNEVLDTLLKDQNTPVNTAANGYFATGLPSELMRWAAKPEEVYAVFAKRAGKLLQWVGEAGEDEELLRRLAEVRGQHELIAKFPDQYWGYRSQVRKQISSRPVSRIQQIKHETDPSGSGIHPDDQRRLEYFKQLSKAIHSQSPQELVKLAEFVAPYDPLVTLFMHQELAEIAARISELPPTFELTHRLHMVNYAPSNDSSVRNALAALRLVLEKPKAVSSALERWEVVNCLLQTLQYRWEHRSPSQNGDARMAARDVEENIILAEKALVELAPLAAEAGLSKADWDNRKRAIERQLIAPLRDYRERLQPLAARQRYLAVDGEVESGLPTAEDLKYPGAPVEVE